jgi:hypothetical protein
MTTVARDRLLGHFLRKKIPGEKHRSYIPERERNLTRSRTGTGY